MENKGITQNILHVWHFDLNERRFKLNLRCANDDASIWRYAVYSNIAGHIAMDIEIINELKKRLTGQSDILDIGFGAGRISFDILGELTVKKITGIESRKKEEIEIDYGTFSGPEMDKGIYGLRKSDGTIDLFDYYKYKVSGLKRELLDLESFKETVSIIFDKTFQEFVRENKNCFDLIILFNVLHYTDIGKPEWVLDQIKTILTEGGLILISFKNYKRSDGDTDEDRQEIDIPGTIKYLGTDFKTIVIKDYETENSTLYLGERYAHNKCIINGGVQCKFVVSFSKYVWCRGAVTRFELPPLLAQR